MENHEEFLKTGGYIGDGAGSIQHETAFQDYLEKYFEFRKAYCVLYIAYKSTLARVIRISYPFREILKKLRRVNAIGKINSLLRMEETRRSFD